MRDLPPHVATTKVEQVVGYARKHQHPATMCHGGKLRVAWDIDPSRLR